MADEQTPTPPPPPGAGAPPPPPPGDAPPPHPGSSLPGGGEPPPPPSGEDSGNRKLMLILSYLGILALIPLLVEQDDREIQWHARNGLGLTVAIILIGLVLGFVVGLLGLEFIGCALNCGFFIVSLGVLIAAMSKALSGQKMRFPVISDFADKA